MNLPTFENDPESQHLLKLRARELFWARLWRVFLGAAAIFICAVLTVNMLQSQAARKELLDCTVEGGDCYTRAQDQTARAIASIIEQDLANTITIVNCAEVTKSLAQLERCVENKSKERKTS